MNHASSIHAYLVQLKLIMTVGQLPMQAAQLSTNTI